MSMTAVKPEALSPLFQKNAWDPLTREPCYPTTTVAVKHHGKQHTVVHPASSSPLTLRARWNGGSKVMGLISPLMNYILNDPSVPSNADFIIA